jgi:hypothetical protein
MQVSIRTLQCQLDKICLTFKNQFQNEKSSRLYRRLFGVCNRM